MRLTVGPLPAAVYWRRRLLVLGALVLVILGIVYACTGGAGAGNQADPGAESTATPTPSGSADATTSPTPTRSPTPSPTASPTPTAFTLPVSQATGPCTNEEIQLAVSASPPSQTVGVGGTFFLKIKNTSQRTCMRDIGSEPQELQLRQADRIVWSSDDCRDPESSYNFDQQFPPGHEVPFTWQWDGFVTRSGAGEVLCGSGVKPDTGHYELVARLGDKFSDPFRLDVNSSGAS